MTKHVVWKKDDFFHPQGLDMDAEAARLPEGRLPIAWMFNFDAHKWYGFASDFKLEDHEITCEVEWTSEDITDEIMEKLELRLGGYYTDVNKINIDGRFRISECELKGVSVMLELQTPGWPKAPTDFEELEKELYPVTKHRQEFPGHSSGAYVPDGETVYYCVDCDWDNT